MRYAASMVDLTETRLLGSLLSNRPCAGDVPWDRMVARARRHGLSPLLYWQLKQRPAPADSVPGDLWSVLERDYFAAVAQGARREKELLCVLEALQGANVPVLVLKGAAFSYTVYPDPAVRPMADVDLLVRRERLPDVRRALEALGYVHRPEPRGRWNPFNTEFTGETSFYVSRYGRTWCTDLHWQLVANEMFQRGANLDGEGLWARAVPFRIGEASALCLSPEDALAHACLHVTTHGFRHQLGTVDVLRMTSAASLDWKEFVGRVKVSRIAVACYFPLWQAERQWCASVPEWVLSALRPGPVRRSLGRRLASAGRDSAPGGGHAWEHFVWLFAVDRLRDLARLLLWLMWPGRSWLRERYAARSSGQAWGWVVLHPLLVLREGVRSLGAVTGRVLRGRLTRSKSE